MPSSVRALASAPRSSSRRASSIRPDCAAEGNAGQPPCCRASGAARRASSPGVPPWGRRHAARLGSSRRRVRTFSASRDWMAALGSSALGMPGGGEGSHAAEASGLKSAVPRRRIVLAVVFVAWAAGARAEVSWRFVDPTLQALAARLAPTLEANRKELHGRTGPVRGFGAGAVYPQIWLRDSATLVPLSRFLYPRKYLDSWLVEHLAHQQDDGALRDWIAAGEPSAFRNDAPRVQAVYRAGPVVISADRNTTEADQETSAVEAAYQVFRITGDRAWLASAVAGRPLGDRLDAPPSFLLPQRLSRGVGLVANAFTRDRGDVGPVYAGQHALHLVDP